MIKIETSSLGLEYRPMCTMCGDRGRLIFVVTGAKWSLLAVEIGLLINIMVGSSIPCLGGI